MAVSTCNNPLIFALTKPSSPLSLNHSKILVSDHPLKPFSSANYFTKSPLTLKILNPLSNPRTPTKYTSTTTSDISISESLTTPKTLKARLSAAETLYGIFFLSFSPTIAEITGLAGYDFVVLDLEHGFGGISEALPCLHALAAAGTAAIIRIPESSEAWAKKALDLGPQGIMFPMIENSKSAKKAVSYCRFPPAGIRGSAHPLVRASKYGFNEGYLNSYEDELLIMCQVESEDGAKNVEEIAGVDGVDCIQMGPLDLSASLGYLWDPGNKKVREAVRAVEKAVLRSGKKGGEKGGAYLGGFAMPYDSPEQIRARGYHMVTGGVDVGLFKNAVAEDVRKFKLNACDGNDKDKEEKKYWSE